MYKRLTVDYNRKDKTLIINTFYNDAIIDRFILNHFKFCDILVHNKNRDLTLYTTYGKITYHDFDKIYISPIAKYYIYIDYNIDN